MKPSTNAALIALGRLLAAFVAAVALLGLAAEAWRPGLAAGIDPAVLVVLAALAAWLASRDAAHAPVSPWMRRAWVLVAAVAAMAMANQWVAGPPGWRWLAIVAAGVAVIGAGW